MLAKGSEKLPKVQKIAQSGHTGYRYHFPNTCFNSQNAMAKLNEEEIKNGSTGFEIFVVDIFSFFRSNTFELIIFIKKT